MKATLIAVFVSIAVVSCGPPSARDFPTIGRVTIITVSGTGASNLSKKITDSQRISRIVAFVDAHRSGWGTPWYGVPVPSVVVEFYDGPEFKGHFGVGKNFLETQRDDSGFFSQSVTSDQVTTFLELLAPRPASRAASVEKHQSDAAVVRDGFLLKTALKTVRNVTVAESQKLQESAMGQFPSARYLPTIRMRHRRRFTSAGLSGRFCELAVFDAGLYVRVGSFDQGA